MSDFAVISDIHANLSALVAVLADIRREGIKEILCLGDIVGYGPDPRECLTLVRRTCRMSIRGNHDQAVLLEPFGFNPRAHEAVLWTRRLIRKRWFSYGETRNNWQFLRQLNSQHFEGDLMYVHGSPRDPVNEYVDERDAEDLGFGPSKKIIEIFQKFDRWCFAGHTHQPCIITDTHHFFYPEDFSYVWDGKGQKLFINPGSVGQPRDGDPRAKYLIVRGDNLIFRRVPYDIEETVAKIREIPQLHDSLARRLYEGI